MDGITIEDFHRVRSEMLYFFFLSSDYCGISPDILTRAFSTKYWLLLSLKDFPTDIDQEEVDEFIGSILVILIAICYEYIYQTWSLWEEVHEEFQSEVEAFEPNSSELCRLKSLLESLVQQCHRIRTNDTTAFGISHDLERELAWAYDTFVADTFRRLSVTI